MSDEKQLPELNELIEILQSKNATKLKKNKIHFTGSRGVVRYSINSGDPDGFFSIDQVSGNIRVANILDHETKSQILLNVQATSGDPPAYGHTQVIICTNNFHFSFNMFLHRASTK